MLLVMGFTGKKATAAKERFITAFKYMEKQLLSKKEESINSGNWLIHQAKMLLAYAEEQARLNKELEAVKKSINDVAVNVQIINKEREDVAQVFDLLQIPDAGTTPITQLTTRQKINQLVRATAQRYGISYQDMFNKLYQSFYYGKDRINIKLRAKNASYDNVLEFAEKEGIIDKVYEHAAALVKTVGDMSTGKSLTTIAPGDLL